MSDPPSEESPYWHSDGQPHRVDLDKRRLLCFEIFNIFTANGALAREFEASDDSEDPSEPSISKLHHEFAEISALEKLLQLRMVLRTYDDIMSQSEHAQRYAVHVKATSGEDSIGHLDGGRLSLREACNKVIHAREVRPGYDSVERAWDGKDEIEKVWHLDGEIELTGTLNKKAWNATLYVRLFRSIGARALAHGRRYRDALRSPDGAQPIAPVFGTAS